MKNHTIIELTKQVEDLNLRIGTLRTALNANTQATGKNTIAVEGITAGLKELAAETGGWRTDDKAHHENEGTLDKQKIAVGKEIVEALKKK